MGNGTTTSSSSSNTEHNESIIRSLTELFINYNNNNHNNININYNINSIPNPNPNIDNINHCSDSGTIRRDPPVGSQ